MKSTLITLSCGLLAAASIQAAELCKAPFDVVQPKVPDKLCRVTLNRQELGGEIDRRIQNLIYKNFMVIDLDGGWLNHFRNRTDRGGASMVYYGIGKVLDAGSLFAAYTGDPKVAARTQYIIDELEKSRDPDGYLGFWKVEPENRQNHINWILHEQEYINLAFVRNYRCTGKPQSLADAKIMGDYILKTFPTPQNPCYDAGLICTAGLPEGMLELYRVTGDKRYLDFAADVPHGNNRSEVQLASLRTWDQDFSRRPCHVYVMLARCYAQTELFRLTGEENLLNMSHFMRQELLKKGEGGMLVTGSSSQDEMFAYNQNGSGAIGESCVTAYMLRWIDSLMRLEGDMRYGDLLERTIYNALLGANSPDGRQIRYYFPFTGDRPYDKYNDTFCCCGNYRRAVAELPQKVYYRTPDGGIALNLFTPSNKAFGVNGQAVTIRQETAYPNDGDVKLTFSTPKPVAFPFQFRTPRWCQKITLRVNDEAPVTIDPLAQKLGSYVLNRTWKDGDAVKLSMPMAWRFLRGRAVQDGRVVLLRGPVVYCVGKARNAGLFAKCPDPRNLVIDPASIAEPTKDDSIRPGGLIAVAKAWLNPERAGEQVDVVLTEFIDPSGQDIYFRVPNLADTSPVRLTDDEIVSWPNENVNAQVLQALYGPKATGDLQAMFEIRGDVVADMAANYVNPGGKTGVKAEFPDATGGRWAFYTCRNGGLLSTAAAGDVKQLDSRFKAFGSPLGFAYGLENQADQLGFVSDYAPSDRQEDAWRVHYTADRFDQVLSAAERNEFLYTHPVADTACYNVFRWTPSADAQKKDITLCGTLFSNLGNGVQLRVIRWNDDTRSEILGTYNTRDLTTGKCGTAGFVLRLKPGEVGKHLDFVLHNAGDYACDASAMKIQALTKVRQPTQTSAQTDVTDKVQAKFQNPAKGVEANLKPIPFADLAPDGLLKARAELSLRRLQEPYFQWVNVSRVNFGAFPGDALGRTINGLTLLSQALNQPEPASLKEIMRRVPSLANPDGYLGPKLPESRANEDTMAGHNGYTYGLMEYALWTKDPETKESLRRMVANLFVPARAAIAGYRETSEAKVDWHLSGGDVGQLFTALDGMTRAYALVPSPEFKATIETAIERYRKLDLVGLSAQTHAMLSAATGILRWHEMHHRPEDLAFAEALYKQYRALAMTETFENYNWFNKPKWTEACAVSDSFILTVNLWRLTGRANYLEDAHLILFNGLLPGQLQNGGFGTGPCVGHATGVCQTKMHSEAPFCCSMRGGEALARAIQYSYFQNKDTVVLPFYANGMATLRFAEGTCKVRQETGYPHQGQVRLEVMESQVNKEKTWRFFVPSWAVRDSFEILVNGKKVEARLVDSFAEIAVRPVAGTVVEVVFQQERGPRPAVQSSQAPGASQYFSGPLLLGSATDNAAEPLVPILDLLGPGGRGGEPCVYFPNGETQAAANVSADRKTPNLADTAQVFRRDMPPDRVPAEVGKLFATLKQDRNLAICGFVWPSPQKVRQVVLQWPESGAMPGPEAIELRWSAAGGLHTAAQPGIIGNGRQWVYTLGKAPEGAVVDGLILVGKNAKEIPDVPAVPDIEVLGNSPAMPSKREADGNKPTAPNVQTLPQQ